MNPVPPVNAGSLTRERHRAKSALIHGTLLTINAHHVPDFSKG